MPNPQVTQPSGSCINGAWVPTPASLTLPSGDGNWLTADDGLAPSVFYPAPVVGAHTYTFVPTAGDKVIYNVTVNAAPAAQPCGPQFGPDQNLLDSTKPTVAADSDTALVELGVKITPARDGQITAIRYYQGSASEKITKVNLYDASGKLAASSAVSASTTIGWKSAPIVGTSVKGGQTYTASYVTSNGRYPATTNGFSKAVTKGDLATPTSAGVYKYGGGYPTQVYQATNYFADVIYNALVGAPVVTTPPSGGGGTTTPPSDGGGTTTPPTGGGGGTTTPPPSGSTPNASNTGVKGLGLDANSLPKVTTAAVTGNVSGKYFSNGINPKTDGATISGCVIIGGLWGVEPNVNNLTFVDCTFIGGDNCCVMDDLYKVNIKYIRCDLSGSTDGMKFSGDQRLVQNCYIHDLHVTSDSHNDGIQCYSGTNWQFIGNYIQGVDTSCISMFEGQGTWKNVTIDGNYFAGQPAFPVYAGGSSASGVVIQNNTFESWAFGPVTDLGSAVWKNNKNAKGQVIDTGGKVIG